METGNEIIGVAGLLCLAAILAGQVSTRIGTPLLLVFIGLGILAGEDGPGGIRFDDFHTAYLVGSIALAVILFEGGLGTKLAVLRRAAAPAAVLATAGVAISAAVVGGVVVMLFGVPWPEALLLGAALAPTDAAAVAVLLRLSPVSVPDRVLGVLEVESGLNDPMSVFLTLVLIEAAGGNTPSLSHAALLFAEEMAGGAAAGLAGGWLMLWLIRRLGAEPGLLPVLGLGGALALFGGCQLLGTSGFLAVYVAGLVLGNTQHPGAPGVPRFFGALGWLAQIALFLMLGLLVTPHELPGSVVPALLVAVVLIVLARPLATAACLLPFRWRWPEIGFVSWVGLRGAVPIYLTIVSGLAGVPHARTLFEVTFVVVIASVALQGWTIGPAARLLGLNGDSEVDGGDGAA